MNSPLPHPPPTGSADELRAFARDCLEIAGEYMNAVDAFLRIGDDRAAARTTHKLVAAVIAHAETVADLRRRSC